MRISTLQKEKTMSNLGIGLQMTGSTIHQECYSVGPGPNYYKVKGSFKVSGREKKNQNKLLSRDTTGGTKSNFVMVKNSSAEYQEVQSN
jgi:hypothetical protein